MKPLDYARRGSWLFRPKTEKLKYATDVFFVYPTVFIYPPNRKHRHNMNPYNPVWRFFAWFLTIWRGSIFRDSCNLYAPHYRQVTIESLERDDGEIEQYGWIALEDVKHAFHYYLEHINQGRPFILAGHSQGAMQLLKMMRDEFQRDREFKKRFVAAYLIGYSVTERNLRDHPHLKMVDGEDDLGGIISYNTSAKGLKLMRVVLPGAVCVNPLNWKKTSEYAPKELNMGSVLFDFGKYFRIEKKRFTGAYIDTKQGVLMIDHDALDALLHVRIAFLNKILIRRGTLHMLDIALFHRNLQHNIKVRIAKYFEQAAAAGAESAD